MKKEEKPKHVNDLFEYYMRDQLRKELGSGINVPHEDDLDEEHFRGIIQRIRSRREKLKQAEEKIKLFLEFRKENSGLKFSTDFEDIVQEVGSAERKDEKEDKIITEMSNLKDSNSVYGHPPTKKRLVKDVMIYISKLGDMTTAQMREKLKDKSYYDSDEISEQYFTDLIRRALDYCHKQGYLTKGKRGRENLYDEGEDFEEGLEKLGMVTNDDYDIESSIEKNRKVLEGTFNETPSK